MIQPGSITSRRGDSSATARMTGSNSRASRARSSSTSTTWGQRAWACRRRCPTTTPSVAAAGVRATTRLAAITAAGTSGVNPAAMTGQSGNHTVTIRCVVEPAQTSQAQTRREGGRSSGTTSSDDIDGIVRTVTAGNVTRHWRRPGTRRPDRCSSTVRCRRCPNPAPRPARDDAAGLDDAVARAWHRSSCDRVIEQDHHGTSLPDPGGQSAQRTGRWAVGRHGSRAARCRNRPTRRPSPRPTTRRRPPIGARTDRVIGSGRCHGNGDHPFEGDAQFRSPHRARTSGRRPPPATLRRRPRPRPPPSRSRWQPDRCRPASGHVPAHAPGTDSANSAATGTVCSCVRTFDAPLTEPAGSADPWPSRCNSPGRNQVDSQLHPSQRIEQTFDTPGVDGVTDGSGGYLAAQRSRAARLRSSRCTGTRLAASDSAASPPPPATITGGGAPRIGFVGGLLFEHRRLHAGLPVLVQIAHHVGEPVGSWPFRGRP